MSSRGFRVPAEEGWQPESDNNERGDGAGMMIEGRSVGEVAFPGQQDDAQAGLDCPVLSKGEVVTTGRNPGSGTWNPGPGRRCE